MNRQIQRLFFPHDEHPSHVKALDGLRGFAVLLVILSHASILDIFLFPELNMMGAGKGGVMLFFVLSAYLLDRQIVLAMIKNRTDTRFWLNYALRRFLRIYPLFAVALIFQLLLHTQGINTVIDQPRDIWQHLLMLKGEGIFWTIAVEFKYYLFSPFILWACHRLFHWKLKPILLFLIALMIASSVADFFFRFPNISTLKYLGIFFLGTGAAIWQVFREEKLKVQFTKPQSTVISLVTLVLAYCLLPKPLAAISFVKIKSHNAITFLLWGLIGTRLLLSVQFLHDPIQRLFSWKPLRFLGQIRFSAYLFHFPILKAIKNLSGIPDSWQLVASLFCILLCSSLTFLLIERPLSQVRLRPTNSNNVQPS